MNVFEEQGFGVAELMHVFGEQGFGVAEPMNGFAEQGFGIAELMNVNCITVRCWKGSVIPHARPAGLIKGTADCARLPIAPD